MRSGEPLCTQIHLESEGVSLAFDVACHPILGNRRRARGSRCFVAARNVARPPPTPKSSLWGIAHQAYPWPLFVLSARGRPLYMNRAAEGLFGLNPHTLTQRLATLPHPDEQLMVRGLWHEALACRRPLQLFARLQVASGAYTTCLIRVDPQFGPKGALSHWLCTTLETDASQRLESVPRPGEAEGVGNSFLTVASHELRTPLTSLQLNLQLALQRLQRQQETPRGSANIESMVSRSLKQTHRLIEVVSDILDASRINQGRLQLRQTRVDLHQILLETLAMFDRPFADVGCRITVQLQDDVYGFWDRGRVEQVFFDLLANVLKHAPGSHVLLTSRVEENVATVTVQDDGPGIDEALHEQIFGRFGRAAECRGISGLGLGLYLCRRIVEDHGGTLEVHSKAGAGATFIARLPLGGLEGTEPGYAPNHHAGPAGAPS
jgi:signal transduction histidine kinase